MGSHPPQLLYFEFLFPQDQSSGFDIFRDIDATADVAGEVSMIIIEWYARDQITTDTHHRASGAGIPFQKFHVFKNR